MTALTVADLTETTLSGTGVFDVLMRANKAHLEAEFTKGRIKGSEYATVYLGSLETVMRSSMEFLLQRQKIGLEADLLAQQILLAQVEVTKATAAVALVQAQTANAVAELAIIQANASKVAAEVAHLTAQTAVSTQQRLNLIDELLTATAQRAKIAADAAHIAGQTAMVAQQTTNLVSEELAIDAKTALLTEQLQTEQARNFVHPTDPLLSGNFEQERRVLTGQKCKLDAEFDLLQSELLKSASEITLLTQKNATEKAQILAIGVDADSVIGKQKLLYQAQTEGFSRDAEQKAAKLMVDTWNVRKTTDPDATDVNVTNQLTDGSIGRAVAKLLTGVGA